MGLFKIKLSFQVRSYGDINEAFVDDQLVTLEAGDARELTTPNSRCPRG